MSYLFDVLVFGLIFAAILHLRAEYRPLRLHSAGAFDAKIPLVSPGCAASACGIAEYFRLLVQGGASTVYNVVSTVRSWLKRPATRTARAPSRIRPRSQAQPNDKKAPAKRPAAAQHNKHPANPAPVSPHPHPDAQNPRSDHAVADPYQAPALPRRHPNAHYPVLAAMRHLEQAYAILAEHANPLYGLDRIRALEKIVAAYAQINLGIAGSTGRSLPDTTPLRGLPSGDDFPPVRRALEKIREAQTELKKVTPYLRGQRTAAVVTLNFAVRDLGLAMHHARALSK